MRNLAAKFGKFFDICKKFSKNLVDEREKKDWQPTFAPFAKARKRVETLFSQMVDQFMLCRNYAKQQVGLFARIISKISATTILQYINFINNKPLEQIKHALL